MTVPGEPAEGNLCECCGRDKKDCGASKRLYRIEWTTGEAHGHAWVCYACRYNTFPPGHALFERVQKWRREHGKSVLAPGQGQQHWVEKVKDKTIKAKPSANPGLAQLQKQVEVEMIAALEHKLATGQIAAGPYSCTWCRKPMPHPAVVVVEGQRKATFGYCGQACCDAYYADIAARHKAAATPQAVLANPWAFGMMPVRSQDGRLVGMYAPGKGIRQLRGVEGEEPVEFCKKCDCLVEVCRCKGGPTL